MTERLHIGTHKGLFELARHNGVWDIADVQFLGDPVSAVLAVTDGIVYAGALRGVVRSTVVAKPRSAAATASSSLRKGARDCLLQQVNRFTARSWS